MSTLDLLHHFTAEDGPVAMRMHGAVRRAWSQGGIDCVRDDFVSDGASCLFIRFRPTAAASVHRLDLGGQHVLRRCDALGGWLVEPAADDGSIFWMPEAPMLRVLDAFGRITAESSAPLADLAIGEAGASAAFAVPDGHVLDWAVWRLAPAGGGAASKDWHREFAAALAIERQPFFIYASHTATRCAADFYRHLVHGSVYGACWAWPKKRKICDELDALALHMIASALGGSTGKRIYDLLRRQIVLAVLCRQEADGGFRHGEWTDEYESHNRLINGAVQLIARELELAPEPPLTDALRRAVHYISEQADPTSHGAWFLHDSLERSEDSMRHYPLAWERGTWLGKSPTNLLILNTHLDCMLSLARYRAVSGDEAYRDLFHSAEQALRAVLSARPAEWLFRPLLSVIALSLLPKAEQERLPFFKRALKRLGWKYVIPRWHLIRRRFPRLLMPAGYIERSLGQADFVHRYHGVHLMDFERLLASKSVNAADPQWTTISDGLVDFGVRSRVSLHWKESAASKDSLAFWAEGLYRRCLRTHASRDHALLASAVLDLHDAGLGLPPALLGINAEARAAGMATATPSAAYAHLHVINLCDRDGPCFMVVNTADFASPLAFEGVASSPWPQFADGEPPLAARGWTVLRPSTGTAPIDRISSSTNSSVS
jgi:hypothetical protein